MGWTNCEMLKMPIKDRAKPSIDLIGHQVFIIDPYRRVNAGEEVRMHEVPYLCTIRASLLYLTQCTLNLNQLETWNCYRDIALRQHAPIKMVLSFYSFWGSIETGLFKSLCIPEGYHCLWSVTTVVTCRIHIEFDSLMVMVSPSESSCVS